MPERNIREHYSHKIADEKKKRKRAEALERQAVRDRRTDAQQITLIKQRPGLSKIELARLIAKGQ